VQIRGTWLCLYHAVEKQGLTADFLLRPDRGFAAAAALNVHHLEPGDVPRVIQQIPSFVPALRANIPCGNKSAPAYRVENIR
jgi:transposase-like protein